MFVVNRNKPEGKEGEEKKEKREKKRIYDFQLSPFYDSSHNLSPSFCILSVVSSQTELYNIRKRKKERRIVVRITHHLFSESYLSSGLSMSNICHPI